MNCKFINVLVFAAGAAIGSAVTWKLLKNKYERLVQEEIEAVKEVYTDRFNDSKDQEETVDGDDDSDGEYRQINWEDLEDLDEDEEDEYVPNQADVDEYKSLVDIYTSEKGGAEDMAKDVAKEPYVISPYDFGELDGYRTFELTYYLDNILEDEDYNIITDADELIGPKALYTFGDYEDDSVFVRNERLRADFQILKDYRTYDEAKSIGPGRVGDE